MIEPSERCGVVMGVDTADRSAIDGSPRGAASCWRPCWRDHDRCVWHADVESKPVADLVEAAPVESDRLDGAVLRETALGNDVDFSECVLRRADLNGANCFAADFGNAVLAEVAASDARFARADLSGVDLRGADLSGADLREADITGADLQDAELGDAILREADLSGANLVGADLTGADLDRADLTEAYLQGATLVDVDLSNAVLTGADLLNADLRRAILRGADLREAGMFDTTLEDAALNRADLTAVDLLDADLTGVNAFGATMVGANLRGATLTDADFRLVDLRDADLRMVDFEDANLERSDLTDANCAEASLTGAVLTETILVGASLRDAVLEKATAHAADFTDVDLIRGDLARTNLFNASLDRAHIYGAVFDNTRINEGTSFHSPHLEPADDESEASRLTKAAWSHRRVEALSQENSLPDQARHHYRRRKDLQRQLYFLRGGGNYLRWAQAWLSNLLIRYGDSPSRVVAASVVIVILCAAMFPLLGGTTPQMESALQQLYFSVITFTTLGYGDFSPATEPARLLATLEAFTGSLLMALVVFVLGRRATW